MGLVPAAAAVSAPSASAPPSATGPAGPPVAPGSTTTAAPGGQPSGTVGASPSGSAPGGQLTITARDGTPLAAIVATPTSAGAHPLAVLPAAWGYADTSLSSQVSQLATRGYVAVAYTTRGFYTSGGTIEAASDQDVSDVSDVITWALRHADVAADRIGVGGLSYGAGIATLAAVHDPRIAVVASLSGWADFGDALYNADTRHKASLNLLASLGKQYGRLGPTFQRIVDDYDADRNIPAILDWAKSRSPAQSLSTFNARRIPMFLSVDYSDAFFSPQSQLDFFAKLTGPKRFWLAPGDHATSEVGGLFGYPNEIWSAAWDWFDRYLRPASPAARAPAPPAIRIITDAGNVETYPDWTSLTRTTSALRLGPVALGSALLSERAPTDAWATTISAAEDTTATSGQILVTKLLASITHRPDQLDLTTVDRRYGLVWQAVPALLPVRLRGIPTLQLTVTPNSPTGTVVAYLYDTDPAGQSTLLAKAVDTCLTAVPGQPLRTSLAFEPVAHDLGIGHHLSVVVDTHDPLYYDMNPPNGSMAISSPRDEPSQLIVPTA